MRVCHAGALVPTLTPRQLDELNNIEVLVVDARGDLARRVARLVSQIGPRIVVPVGWQAAEDDRDDISALQPLLGELGITDAPVPVQPPRHPNEPAERAECSPPCAASHRRARQIKLISPLPLGEG